MIIEVQGDISLMFIEAGRFKKKRGETPAKLIIIKKGGPRLQIPIRRALTAYMIKRTLKMWAKKNDNVRKES